MYIRWDERQRMQRTVTYRQPLLVFAPPAPRIGNARHRRVLPNKVQPTPKSFKCFEFWSCRLLLLPKRLSSNCQCRYCMHMTCARHMLCRPAAVSSERYVSSYGSAALDLHHFAQYSFAHCAPADIHPGLSVKHERTLTPRN